MMSEAPDDFPLPGDGLDLPDLGSGFDNLPVPHPAPPVANGPRASLAPLAEVPVTVEAVLGGCTLTVDELLGLGAGSVIEVDRRVGDPIDLMVGGRLLARGELVLIDGALGLTLTELVRREDA
ncbi:FliM/FliN family flagellar motor switch protein [Sphingomonas sp. LHG3443-2]|uniref:FliM/FliN family flagellar motor switch protein n=1 Tax=Sphingomonas sp. LHG3443-2 TaxID=2804639 RepID=UPI003CF02209